MLNVFIIRDVSVKLNERVLEIRSMSVYLSVDYRKHQGRNQLFMLLDRLVANVDSSRLNVIIIRS